MAQSSGPISQGTLAERQFTDVLWRDLFGDEPGVIGDMDGTAYAVTLPGSGDVVSVGSPTEVSTASVAGFVHRIPTASTEPLTIPAASGAARTDIISLRYDPAYTGAPGPVRLFRIPGTTSALPAYDAAPPGVEDLPLWAITRQPSQALNLATLLRLYPRRAPVLHIAEAAPLPLSSPLGTLLFKGSNLQYRRDLSIANVPQWEQVVPDTVAKGIVENGYASTGTQFNYGGTVGVETRIQGATILGAPLRTARIYKVTQVGKPYTGTADRTISIRIRASRTGTPTTSSIAIAAADFKQSGVGVANTENKTVIGYFTIGTAANYNIAPFGVAASGDWAMAVGDLGRFDITVEDLGPVAPGVTGLPQVP